VGAEKGRPLPLAAAALVLAATPEREEERVAASIVHRDEETMRRTTRLVIDLRSRRPVDRMELDVAERSFHRVVLIEAGDDRKAWRWIGSFAIGAVDTGQVRERLTGARFPETTARYLRLTVQNLDEQAITVTGARVFAVKRTIVFEATPGRAYVLDYGNPSAAAPRYDVARALTSLGGERLPEATLGDAQRVPAPPRSPWLASQPIVRWASLAMAGLALGSLLWRMARGFGAGGAIGRALLVLVVLAGCSPGETPQQQAAARLARAEAAMEECKRSVGLADVATPTVVILDDPATRGQAMTPEMAGQLRLKIQCRLQLDELLAARRPR
jgi:hypothetical protein